MRDAQMNYDALTLLWKFGGAYGRHCALVAAALARGHGRDQVLEASRGKGSAVAPTYVNLRKQRAKVNSAIMLCRAAGVTDQEMIETARATRTAVEQEFMLRIPRM